MSDVIKNLPTPDPRLLRAQARAQAKADSLAKTGCPHPMSAMYQFEDQVNERDRYGRPSNLFQCDVCKQLLRLVDFHGREATEG